MKSSHKALIGFAVVAAVVVGVIALNYPPADKQDTQGSIGAVEKYRAEQIKPSDVVLGDEQARKEEAVLYGEFLQQAAQLQSMSAALASAARGLDNKQNLESLTKTIDNRENDLGVKVLAAIADLQAREQLAAFQPDLQSIQKGFENRAELNAKQLASFDASLGSVIKTLEAKMNLEAKSLMAADKSLESRQQLNARDASLESMKNDLGSMAADLQARDQLAARVMESRMLMSKLQELGVRVLEQKLVLGVKQQLEAVDRGLEAKTNLSAQAEALGARSAECLNLSAKLESFALANMNARLEMRNLDAKVGLNAKQMVESAARGLESKSQLGAQDLASKQSELLSFSKTLDNRQADLNQKFAFGMQAELAAISQHLEARSDLAVKSNLGVKSGLESKENLGVKSNLGSESALGSKENLGANATLASFNNYLGSLTRSLESRQDLAARENDLGVKAQELQNRAAELQSKAQMP